MILEIVHTEPAHAPKLTDAPTEAYPLAAALPKDSRLDCGNLTPRFGCHLPDWHIAVSPGIAERCEQGVVA